MDWGSWIKPLGIITYAFLIVTVISGRFRAKLKLKLFHHKLLAYTAVVLATLHALLIFLLS